MSETRRAWNPERVERILELLESIATSLKFMAPYFEDGIPVVVFDDYREVTH